jgi:hypothetical protein
MLLFVALAASAARIDQPAGRWSFTLQVSFYAVAALGWGLGRSRSRVPLLGIPYVFCLLNWTTVVAFWRFATRRQRVTWARSVLPPDLPPTEPTRGGESKPYVSGEAR